MSDIINHPLSVMFMTIVLGFQWFMVGIQFAANAPGLLAFHLATAVVTTVAVICYHLNGLKTARSQGRIEGLYSAHPSLRGRL